MTSRAIVYVKGGYARKLVNRKAKAIENGDSPKAKDATTVLIDAMKNVLDTTKEIHIECVSG
eukprot:scaffold2257_cov169-Amphora_coffeaeformis.AAC.13